MCWTTPLQAFGKHGLGRHFPCLTLENVKLKMSSSQNRLAWTKNAFVQTDIQKFVPHVLIQELTLIGPLMDMLTDVSLLLALLIYKNLCMTFIFLTPPWPMLRLLSMQPSDVGNTLTSLQAKSVTGQDTLVDNTPLVPNSKNTCKYVTLYLSSDNNPSFFFSLKFER